MTSAKARVARGYYSIESVKVERRNLTAVLKTDAKVPIIAELKFRSPTEGKLTEEKDVVGIVRSYQRGGAVGISVVTEPDHFDGRIEYVTEVKKAVSVPVLMKDIIVDRAQVDAASKAGADAVLLIAAVFPGEGGAAKIDDLVRVSHDKGIQVLLEVHNREEYKAALSTDADIIGVNNRDLRTLEVSLETSTSILSSGPHPKPVICESGISQRTQIENLRDLGADGFLLGSALMKSTDREGMLWGLTEVR